MCAFKVRGCDVHTPIILVLNLFYIVSSRTAWDFVYFKFTYEIFRHAYIQTDQIYPIPSYLIPLLIPTIFSHPTSCTLFWGINTCWVHLVLFVCVWAWKHHLLDCGQLFMAHEANGPFSQPLVVNSSLARGGISWDPSPSMLVASLLLYTDFALKHKKSRSKTFQNVVQSFSFTPHGLLPDLMVL